MRVYKDSATNYGTSCTWLFQSSNLLADKEIKGGLYDRSNFQKNLSIHKTWNKKWVSDTVRVGHSGLNVLIGEAVECIYVGQSFRKYLLELVGQIIWVIYATHFHTSLNTYPIRAPPHNSLTPRDSAEFIVIQYEVHTHRVVNSTFSSIYIVADIGRKIRYEL